MSIKEQRIAEVLRDCMPEGTTIGEICGVIRSAALAFQSRGNGDMTVDVPAGTIPVPGTDYLGAAVRTYRLTEEEFRFKPGKPWSYVDVRRLL